MRIPRLLALPTLGLAAALSPILAHHSVSAEYDLSKTTTLQGKIASVTWINPHANIFVDVSAPDGKANRWTVEIGAPAALPSGTRARLNAGEMVSVEAWTAKDGSLRAHAVKLTLADGTALSAIDNWDKLSLEMYQRKQR